MSNNYIVLYRAGYFGAESFNSLDDIAEFVAENSWSIPLHGGKCAPSSFELHGIYRVAEEYDENFLCQQCDLEKLRLDYKAKKEKDHEVIHGKIKEKALQKKEEKERLEYERLKQKYENK